MEEDSKGSKRRSTNKSRKALQDKQLTTACTSAEGTRGGCGPHVLAERKLISCCVWRLGSVEWISQDETLLWAILFFIIDYMLINFLN